MGHQTVRKNLMMMRKRKKLTSLRRVRGVHQARVKQQKLRRRKKPRCRRRRSLRRTRRQPPSWWWPRGASPLSLRGTSQGRGRAGGRSRADGRKNDLSTNMQHHSLPSFISCLSHLLLFLLTTVLCIDSTVIVSLKPYIVCDHHFGNKDPPTCIYKVSEAFEKNTYFWL